MRVVRGDITAERTEVIVNAANGQLLHGGGVAAAISKKGGAAIQKESTEWVKRNGPIPTGDVAITSAGNLSAKYVIHAVGPVWSKGDGERLLGAAVRTSLECADAHEVTSISIPAISSGIFGGPKDVCAHVIISTTREYLENHPESTLREVHLCNIDAETCNVFMQATKALLA